MADLSLVSLSSPSCWASSPEELWGKMSLGVKLFSRRSSLQLANMECVANCVQIKGMPPPPIYLRNLLDTDTPLRLLAVFLVTAECEGFLLVCLPAWENPRENTPIKEAAALAKSSVVSLKLLSILKNYLGTYIFPPLMLVFQRGTNPWRLCASWDLSIYRSRASNVLGLSYEWLISQMEL